MFEREYRDLSHVPRWGIVPTIQKQDVAQHSYYVTLYVTHILFKLKLDPKFTPPAIYHALEHDRAESFTGDIVGPAKHNMLSDPRGWETTEENKRFETNNFSRVAESAKDFNNAQFNNGISMAIVKLADLMDQYAFWKEEGKLGNGRTGQMLRDIKPRLDAAAERVGLITNAYKEDEAKIYIEARVMDEFYRECDKEKMLPKEPK